MLPVTVVSHLHRCSHDKVVCTANSNGGCSGIVALNADASVSGCCSNPGHMGIVRCDLVERGGIGRSQHRGNVYIAAHSYMVEFVDGSTLWQGRVYHRDFARSG